MEIGHTFIEGLLVLRPKVFRDTRGYFFESYNEALLQKAGHSLHFVQDNQSLSQKGVLRGLHFQNPPHAQGKLVRVITGRVLDVAVDIRKGSPTYGQHFAIELSGENCTQLYIPPGFAHGFLTLEDHTIFTYKCTAYYHKAAEDCISWNDPALNINWNIADPVVSEKDSMGKSFRTFKSLF
jgi:dTDP-4-dehydrorhamnose 3,5-epimerase